MPQRDDDTIYIIVYMIYLLIPEEIYIYADFSSDDLRLAFQHESSCNTILRATAKAIFYHINKWVKLEIHHKVKFINIYIHINIKKVLSKENKKITYNKCTC